MRWRSGCGTGEVIKYHATSVEEYIRKNKNRMINHDFQPEEYVLVINKSKPAKEEGQKCCTGYIGPWIVIYRLRSGTYRLAELNRAVSCFVFEVGSASSHITDETIKQYQWLRSWKVGTSITLANDDESVLDADNKYFWWEWTTGETKRDQPNMHVDSSVFR